VALVIDLPKGVWRWIADNAKDMARIAAALGKIAEEIARTGAEMEDEDREEDGSQ
jgi:hypothetical protein